MAASPQTPWQSLITYNSQRMHVAAVYCSDGRVGEHFDDFLQNGLGLPRYDRVALPGGPACLAGYDEARVEQVGIVDELKFLIDAHGLTRIVLIQHEACAFYTARLKVGDRQLEHLQRADLVRAAYFIRHVTNLERIDAFFARRTDKAINFEPVTID
ncbi:MAG TPA: carbonic anhydrase [Phycisphaerales bacterium]|nr:carbonic anhydrase [Phycisphaerales bacterium]